uniref:DUF148 domain-containing protein n=1 Tax=Rhabditophanes sp. KR3021 TaxID=114890 RepID=A0AC35TUP1_9BILA
MKIWIFSIFIVFIFAVSFISAQGTSPIESDKVAEERNKSIVFAVKELQQSTSVTKPEKKEHVVVKKIVKVKKFAPKKGVKLSKYRKVAGKGDAATEHSKAVQKAAVVSQLRKELKENNDNIVRSQIILLRKELNRLQKITSSLNRAVEHQAYQRKLILSNPATTTHFNKTELANKRKSKKHVAHSSGEEKIKRFGAFRGDSIPKIIKHKSRAHKKIENKEENNYNNNSNNNNFTTKSEILVLRKVQKNSKFSSNPNGDTSNVPINTPESKTL